MVRVFIENKDKFLRFRQNQIIDILGKPDNLTLYERGSDDLLLLYHVPPKLPGCVVQGRGAEGEVRDPLRRIKPLKGGLCVQLLVFFL